MDYLLSANQGKGVIGTNAAQELELRADIAQAKQRNATDIRVNQEQVDAQMVHVGKNRPDLQYTITHPDGRKERIYIEYDTVKSKRGMDHMNRIIANDPKATVILKIVQ